MEQPPPPPPPPFSNASSKRILRSNNVAKQVERTKPPKNSRKASFIKLLGVDFSKQLKIPDDFVAVFNGRVPHRFIIESDMTKECWRVEMEEDEGVYLREGWAEFVAAHHLKVGDFLLFEYEEQSIFLVKVYNRNGCQKTVVSAQGDKNNPLKINDLEEQDDSEPFESPTKIRRTDRSCKKQRKRPFTATMEAPKVNINPEFCVPNEHPAFFKIYLPESCSMALCIPPSFIKNFDEPIPHSVSLTDSTGRIWPAELGIRSHEWHITEGWHQCAKDLKLKYGEFVVLQYVQNSTFLVTAYGIDRCKKKLSGERIQKNRGDGFVAASGGYPADLTTPDPKICFQKIFNSKNFVTIPNKVLLKCIFSSDQEVTVRSNDGHFTTSQVRATADRVVLGYTGLLKLWDRMGVLKGDKLQFEVICDNGNKIKEIVVTNLSQCGRV